MKRVHLEFNHFLLCHWHCKLFKNRAWCLSNYTPVSVYILCTLISIVSDQCIVMIIRLFTSICLVCNLSIFNVESLYALLWLWSGLFQHLVLVTYTARNTSLVSSRSYHLRIQSLPFRGAMQTEECVNESFSAINSWNSRALS